MAAQRPERMQARLRSHQTTNERGGMSHTSGAHGPASKEHVAHAQDVCRTVTYTAPVIDAQGARPLHTA
jgi:hypothetical protein